MEAMHEGQHEASFLPFYAEMHVCHYHVSFGLQPLIDTVCVVDRREILHTWDFRNSQITPVDNGRGMST